MNVTFPTNSSVILALAFSDAVSDDSLSGDFFDNHPRWALMVNSALPEVLLIFRTAYPGQVKWPKRFGSNRLITDLWALLFFHGKIRVRISAS